MASGELSGSPFSAPLLCWIASRPALSADLAARVCPGAGTSSSRSARPCPRPGCSHGRRCCRAAYARVPRWYRRRKRCGRLLRLPLSSLHFRPFLGFHFLCFSACPLSCAAAWDRRVWERSPSGSGAAERCAVGFGRGSRAAASGHRRHRAATPAAGTQQSGAADELGGAQGASTRRRQRGADPRAATGRGGSEGGAARRAAINAALIWTSQE